MTKIETIVCGKEYGDDAVQSMTFLKEQDMSNVYVKDHTVPGVNECGIVRFVGIKGHNREGKSLLRK